MVRGEPFIHPPEAGFLEFILAFSPRYVINTIMIQRKRLSQIESMLSRQAAVGLLGPRQVGKTTLALQIAESRPSLYLDLESPSDREKLANAELYLPRHEDKLVILDEIQRAPEVFQVLRGIIDQGRRKGRGTGRFLVLGSASQDLLQQSSESLAGRIAYAELGGLTALEVDADPLSQDRLWRRGGFPESFLAKDEKDSVAWREDFIRTYLERDIPQLGPRIPSETLRRFWTMLAHNQGMTINGARLAAALGVSGQTIGRYLDLLADLLLVRRLPPWRSNAGKRMVKSPKVYVRDSGMVHRLLGIEDHEALLGHPVAGASWEGFVIETLISAIQGYPDAYFYRTAAGAEIDLVLNLPGHRRWAIEIKRSLTPKAGKGFHHGCADVHPEAQFIVYPGKEHYPITADLAAIPLCDLARKIEHASRTS